MEPLNFNPEALDRKIAQQQEDREVTMADQAQAEQQQQLNEEAGKNNPPNALQEAGTAVAGGLAQAASDIVTLPERVVDMFNGEMEEAGADYKPDWDPFQPDQFETTTKWGGFLKGAINVGSMFIPVGGVARALGAAGKLTTAVKATGIGAKLAKSAAAGNKAAQGAIIAGKGAIKGAAVDLVLSSSQEENLSQVVTEFYPPLGAVLGPLATNENDHPAMKTFKNVVEGLGMGAIIDALFMTGKAGLGGALDVAKRNNNVKNQIIKKGKQELADPGMRGHKNEPIASRTQGNPNSTGSPVEISRQLDQIELDAAAKDGSTDAPIDVLNAEVAATTKNGTANVLKDISDNLALDPRFQEQFKDVVAGRRSFEEVSPRVARRVREIVGGRNIEDADLDGFLLRSQKDQLLGQTVRSPQDLFALDVMVSALGKQVRDIAVAGREVKDFVDMSEPDGILKTLKDRLTTAMVATKQAKYVSKTKIGVDEATIRSNLEEIETTTQSQISEFMKFVADNPNSKVSDAFLESISMSDNIHNLKDLDAFLSAKINGGKFGGQEYQSLVTKELGGVMVNSILSGPKTPVRAITGTSAAAVTRYLAQSAGALIRAPFTGDYATAKAAIASTGALVDAVPEAFQVFKSRLKSYWSGEINPRTRFSEYDKTNESWDLYSDWIEKNGSESQKAAFRVANIARGMNDNRFLTYSTSFMAAGDDAWRVLLARARAKEKATRLVLDNKKNGIILDAEDLKNSEDLFYSKLLDQDGNIDLNSDTYLKSIYEEATLTTELDGFSKGLEDVFSRTPWTKPFFLFARTGVNGLALTAKNTPLIGTLLTKQRNILSASADNLDAVRQYGINSVEDLANEKALIIGRQTLGTAVVFMAGQAYMAGNLRGNGPQDRQQRQMWKDAGWRANEINLGGMWVNTKAIEPFNTILDLVADIGDAQQTMGEKWTENTLLHVANIVGSAMTEKSYLSSLSDFADLFNNDPRALNRTAANLLNNTVPLGGLRNEIGKLITPYTRELSSSIADSVRNRNLLTENFTNDPLAIKYDILNGDPIRDDNFMVRMFNAVSPVTLNFDNSPGRELLFNSNYDTRASTMASPTGVSLADHPKVRSMFQKALGEQNLEADLNRLSRRKDVIASVETMQDDINSGVFNDPDKAYVHNRLIRRLFRQARKKAWAQIANHPDVLPLVEEQRQKKADNYRSLQSTKSVDSTLLIPTR